MSVIAASALRQITTDVWHQSPRPHDTTPSPSAVTMNQLHLTLYYLSTLFTSVTARHIWCKQTIRSTPADTVIFNVADRLLSTNSMHTDQQAVIIKYLRSLLCNLVAYPLQNHHCPHYISQQRNLPENYLSLSTWNICIMARTVLRYFSMSGATIGPGGDMTPPHFQTQGGTGGT